MEDAGRSRRPMRRAAALAMLTLLACSEPEPVPKRAQRASPEPPGGNEGAHHEPAKLQLEAPGRWTRVPNRRRDTQQGEVQRKLVEELEAIGYASGSVVAGEQRGVTRHDAARSQPGLNFITSGHAPEAVLMDARGRVLHRWHKSFREVWPGAVKVDEELVSFWRRARLLEDGGVLAIFEGHGLIRLDRDSRLLWARRNGAHHDLDIDEQGRIWLLTREAHVIPRLNASVPILEDAISVLSSDGLELRRISLLESLEQSPYFEHFRAAIMRGGDIMHTNTLSILDGVASGTTPALAAGHILLSSYYLHFVAVLDPATEEIVWLKQGRYRYQHDPQMLANGRMMIFDNRGLGEASSVVEIDPATLDVLWEYRGDETESFYTRTCGTAQRLSNGNTLITESDPGRAFEVTADGEIVWEYANPHRSGEADEYVATLFEVWRLSPEFPLDWLPKDSASADEHSSERAR